MNKTALKLALLSTAAAVLTAVPALADTVNYSLTTIDPTVAAGNSMTFNGSLAAPLTNAGDLAILSDSFSVDSPLVLDDTDFYFDTPFFLSPGSTYTGPLFTVTLPSTTPNGLYNGFFDVSLSDAAGNPVEANASFQVTAGSAAAVTPEPGTWLLLATGLIGGVLLRRRAQAA